jgi:thioredoxin reductase (NADPH)
MSQHHQVIIIGAGPAGLTAAIYLARARVDTLVVDSGTPGGQMLLTYDIANYPGIEMASGREIAGTMLAQAKSFGARVVSHAEIEGLDLAATPKRIEVEDEGTITADAVILATGGVPRKLGLESEERFQGLGISYCATCDGDFFTGKEIAVIGGGNSAIEEAIALTRYATKVTVIHEFDHFQAQPWILEEAQQNPRIHFLTEQTVEGFEGEEHLERVISTHKRTGERTETPAEGTFVFIGYTPQTELVADQLALSERGEIVTDENLATSLPGVFAAGDSRVKRYRQITTSVGDGTIAALAAIEHLRDLATKDDGAARARITEAIADHGSASPAAG